MNNRKIYCLGEAIYDIIIKGGKPVDGKVGGALLNTAVSLGRVGIPVEYIGDTGDDSIGDLMKEFLVKNRVGIENFVSYTGSRSRLAVAFIDNKNHPRYVFYKLDSPTPPKLKVPKINKDDIIVFGSFFGIKESIRKDVVEFITEARNSGAIIIYDPNFRVNHIPLLERVRPFIHENIILSDITKGSDDDFKLIMQTENFEQTLDNIIEISPSTFMYTANKKGIWYKVNEKTGHYKSKEIAPLSAIGAGDAFNAGIAYSIYKLGITKDNFSEKLNQNIEEIIKIADEFAIDVCLSFDNYIGEDIIKRYGQF